MIKEKLADICFNFGDLDETEGDWKQFSYSLDDLKDKKYVVITTVDSSKVGYEIKGEDDLKTVEALILAFEMHKDEDDDEEGIEVFDVVEDKFLNYDVKVEKSMKIEWKGLI